MKSWKNRWKEEIDSVVPKLSDEVYNAPIIIDNNGEVATLGNNKKKFFSIISICLAFILAISAFLIMYFNKKPNLTPSTNLFVLEINPSVAFAVNQEDKVENVSALNFDADVILSNEESLNSIIGKPITKAVNTFVEYSAMYGYIDLDLNMQDNKVNIKLSSYGDYDMTAVKSSIEDLLNQKGLYNNVQWEKNLNKTSFCELLGLDNSVSDIVKEVKQMQPTLSQKANNNVDLLKTYLDGIIEESVLDSDFKLLLLGMLNTINTLPDGELKEGIIQNVNDKIKNYHKDKREHLQQMNKDIFNNKWNNGLGKN